MAAPLLFSQWCRASFVVDDVSCPCAEQFMVAEKTRLFQDSYTEELIMSSPTRAGTSALVEACVISTTLLRTAFEKTPSLLAPSPISHRTRP